MRGEIIYKILSSLEKKTINILDLMDVFISSGYGANINKIEYELGKKNKKRIGKQINKDKIRKIKKYLFKLDKDGLISKNLSGEVILTQKGKSKLNLFKKSFLLNKVKYRKEVSNNTIVISYDIPVLFNKERNILRNILKYLDFNLIHRSVWVGKTKLPKEFIFDLEKLGILDYVEILEVTKNGSLRPKN